ncbi:hypothetical protein [Catellatospora sp. NPDC049609]
MLAGTITVLASAAAGVAMARRSGLPLRRREVRLTLRAAFGRPVSALS